MLPFDFADTSVRISVGNIACAQLKEHLMLLKAVGRADHMSQSACP